MNQKQSEEFDSRLRILANEAECSYHEKSWIEMEKLLDKKKRRGFLWWPWLISGSLMISVGLGLFLFSDHFTNPVQLASNKSTRDSSFKNSMTYSIIATANNIFNYNEASYPGNLMGSNSPDILNASLPSNTNVDALGKNSDLANVNPSPSSPSLKQTSASNFKAASILGSKKRTPGNSDRTIASYKSNQKLNLDNNSSTSKPISAFQPQPGVNHLEIAQNSGVYKLTLDDLTRVTPKEGILAQQTWNVALLWNGFKPLYFSSELPDVDVPKIKSKSKKKANSALLIVAQWAPEFSSVPQRSFGSLAHGYGFRLKYQFNNRLTLVTGLQKTPKNYPAEKSDYFVEKSSYFYNLKFGPIAGACSVIELPLTIQYNLFNKKTSSFSLNVGLTSMRMDSESFEYDFYHVTGRKSHKVDKYVTKKWNWLSGATVGLGYQKKIIKNLSAVINPYYTIPLKGVGEGKIKIQSLGTQLGLQYSIPTNGR